MRPYVLPVVKKADAILLNNENLDHEYQPIAGTPSFTRAAAELILGRDSPAFRENRVAAVQTISGIGANHTGAVFWPSFIPKVASVTFPNLLGVYIYVVAVFGGDPCYDSLYVM